MPRLSGLTKKLRSKKKANGGRRRPRGGFFSSFANSVAGSDSGTSRSRSGLSGLAARFGTVDVTQVNIPSLKTPSHEQGETRASVTTLNRQLKALAVIATQVGVLNQQQQETLLAQIKEDNRAAREAQVEGRNAEQVSNTAVANPLDDMVTGLLAAITSLSDAIQEQVLAADGNSKGFLGGILGGGVRGAGAKPKLKKGFGYDKKAKRYYQKGANGKRLFVKEESALKNASKANLVTNAARMRRAEGYVAKNAVKVKKSTAASAGVAGVIGRSANKVGGGAVTATKATIARVAAPLVKNAVVKTAIKSIPIVGALAGVGFAASRLLEGDYVGAGLDLVSGIAGPVTAIPALVASLSRDVYTGAYQTQPEEDPLFKERMVLVTAVVSKLVKNWIEDKISDAEPVKNADPTTRQSAASRAASQGRGSSKTATPTSRAPATVAAVAAISSGGARGGGGGGSRPPMSPSAAVGSRGSTVESNIGPIASNTPTPEPVAPVTPVPPAEPVAAVQRDASIINTAAEAAETNNEAGVSTTNPATPRPSKSPTTKSGATGMGNVPDPTYFGIEFNMADQMYFGATA